MRPSESARASSLHQPGSCLMHLYGPSFHFSAIQVLNCFFSFTLSASFHKYGNVCGERDGVEFAKRRRRDVVCIAEEERQRNRCRPAATLWAEGIVGDLCVPCRRRCPCIASSSLLDLASQAPSANVIVFMKRGT